MPLPGVTLFLLALILVPTVGAADDDAAKQEITGNQPFRDGRIGRTPMDLDTEFINRHSQERAVFASKMALRQIWNKAQHVIHAKNNDIYLLVRGFRDDAVHDFKSFKPTEKWTDFGDGALYGQSGDRIVRLNPTEAGSFPVLEIMRDIPSHYSKTSVIYADSLEQMEKAYNFIKKHNDIVKP